MNINRITYLSQFITPYIEKGVKVEKEEKPYYRVESTSKNDHDPNRREEHGPMYYYELMKNNPHQLKIKDKLK